jgi:hypothetical protein
LPHRLVDEVVRRALELTAHLLEDLPEVVATLEVAERLLVLFLAHGLLPALSAPQAIAGALAPFPRSAGSASSLLGFFQSTTSAMVGMAVAISFDGTPRAMAGFVCLLGLLTFTAHRLIVKRIPEHERRRAAQ